MAGRRGASVVSRLLTICRRYIGFGELRWLARASMARRDFQWLVRPRCEILRGYRYVTKYSFLLLL
jgi:hypothetical protein